MVRSARARPIQSALGTRHPCGPTQSAPGTRRPAPARSSQRRPIQSARPGPIQSATRGKPSQGRVSKVRASQGPMKSMGYGQSAQVRAGVGRATPHGGGSAGGRMIFIPPESGGLKFFAYQNFLQKFFYNNFKYLMRCLQFVQSKV